MFRTQDKPFIKRELEVIKIKRCRRYLADLFLLIQVQILYEFNKNLTFLRNTNFNFL